MNKLGTKLGAVAMSAVMALSFAPSAAITSLAAGDGLTDPIADSYQTVYVCYDANSGEHLWTTEKAEADWLVNEQGWLEGNPAWKAPSIAGEPVYRLYSPSTGEHHYTANKNEATWLEGLGWNNEKVAFLTPDPEDDGATPILCYRNPNGGRGAHQYTISEEEAEFLDGIGWGEEDPRFYGYELTFDPVVEELTVSIDNTTPKVGDTLTAIVEGGEAASYAWYILDAVTDSYEELIPVSTESSYTVLPVDKNKYVQVVVTAANGNEFPSEKTTPVINADLSKEVKITDREGLQNDGTALPSDHLDLTYGSGLGTPETIAWYKDGALKQIQTARGGIGFASFTVQPVAVCGTATLSKGEWYVIIQNTDGENFTSNSIVVTEGDLAVMSDVTFTDDYDGKNVEIDAKVDATVVTVTLNKDYTGDFYIAPAKDTTKYNYIDLDQTISTAALKATGNRVTNLKKFTDTEAVNAGAGDGIYYLDDETGVITYKFVIDVLGASTGAATRGSDYYLIFDQANTDVDDLATTAGTGDLKDLDLNMTEALTVPYVVAPDEVLFTAFNQAGKSGKLEFVDDDGEALPWLDGGTWATDGDGFASITVYNPANNETAKDDAKITFATASIDGGTFSWTQTAAITNKYAYAKVTTTKGVYAADSLTYETPIIETAGDPADAMKLKEDSTDPAKAVVEFTNLTSRVNGTVYILQGEDGDTNFAGMADNSIDNAIASAEVPGGSKKIEIDDVFKAAQLDTTSGNDSANIFIAVYVPENTDMYNVMKAGTNATTVFTLTQVPTTLAIDSSKETVTTTSGVIATDNMTSKVYDQFGGEITTAIAGGFVGAGGAAKTYEMTVLKADGTAAASAKTAVLTVEAGGTAGKAKITLTTYNRAGAVADDPGTTDKEAKFYAKVGNTYVVATKTDNNAEWTITTSDSQPE